MRTKDKGIKKKIWISFCGVHHEYNPDCKTCNEGYWNNIFLLKLNLLLYKISPTIWKKIQNIKWKN